MFQQNFLDNKWRIQAMFLSPLPSLHTCNTWKKCFHKSSEQKLFNIFLFPLKVKWQWRKYYFNQRKMERNIIIMSWYDFENVQSILFQFWPFLWRFFGHLKSPIKMALDRVNALIYWYKYPVIPVIL